ncbi:MAG: hypothetical protein BJ554DRAFT_8175 [Olpidium bornovanus]|uniref:Cation-transporting P-type ATPase C-terminal domain-containing protein n=1 Tax=Olpidium bornovanus TaxID=278681 RepID=A0A8H7ZV54_9FUNG|nr:MAG: hypothetical protein BJ554DRAFT_8175 [Olpidium bornovanus]
MSTDISVHEDVETSSVRRHIASGQLSQFDKMLPKLRVLARSSPKDKQILVEHLKSLGETVAVTGDGANDGPALKAADVGFAMGIAGSGIAKEAASIILLDDNFVSLVTALVWGRSISESVRKFLMFQLTVNVTAVTLALISSIVDSESESVLTAVQLLWVNLLMDSLGALALATDEPNEVETLSKPPVNNKKEPLITWNMRCMILGEAVVLCGATLILLYAGPSFFAHLMSDLPASGPERDEALRNSIRTAVFNTFVMFNLCNEINVRRTDRTLNVFRGILQNHIFMIILFTTFVIQVIIVQFGSYAFKTVGGLNGYLWMLCILVGLLAFPVGLFVRIVFFRATPRAKPVKLDVYPTINPSWKRELLWRRAFRMALMQSCLPRNGDVMTIQLPVPIYNNLKSALEQQAVPEGATATASAGISADAAPLPSATDAAAAKPSTSVAPGLTAPHPLQRRPTIPMRLSFSRTAPNAVKQFG